MVRASLTVLITAVLGSFTVENVQADPLAILAAAKGQVRVLPASGGDPQQATFGHPLEGGDTVELGDDGSATVVFNDGNVIELSSGSSITIGGRVSDAPKAASLPDDVFGQVSKYVTGGSRQKGLVALSAMRSGTDDKGAILLSPRESDVMTDRPGFSWRAVQGATRYKLSVSGEQGEIWGLETDETHVRFPADIDPLRGGADYLWSIQAMGDAGLIRDEETFFHVLDDESRELMAEHIDHIGQSAGGRDTPATHFLCGSYLFTRGVYGDAAEHFEALSRHSPESPAPHEALGNVYRAVGLMDLAAAEFERALSLTRER